MLVASYPAGGVYTHTHAVTEGPCCIVVLLYYSEPCMGWCLVMPHCTSSSSCNCNRYSLFN